MLPPLNTPLQCLEFRDFISYDNFVFQFLCLIIIILIGSGNRSVVVVVVAVVVVVVVVVVIVVVVVVDCSTFPSLSMFSICRSFFLTLGC